MKTGMLNKAFFQIMVFKGRKNCFIKNHEICFKNGMNLVHERKICGKKKNNNEVVDSDNIFCEAEITCGLMGTVCVAAMSC